MTQLVLATAGAVVGNAILPGLGGYIGWGLGSMLGGALGPGQHTEGNRLQDLRAGKTQYGAKIPRIYGRVRTAGIIFWQSDLEEVATTTEQGGKGGPSVSTTTYSYYRSVLYGFAEYAFGAGIIPTKITRIWRNGKLIWSGLNDAEAASIDASAVTDAFDEFEFFDGNPSQLPWSVYETAVGSANANAYRYRATCGVTRINCGNSDQLPYLEFEVVTEATGDARASGGFKALTHGTGNFPTIPDAVPGDGLVLLVYSQFDGSPSAPSGYQLAGTRSNSAGNFSFYTKLATGSDSIILTPTGGATLSWGVLCIGGVDDPNFPGSLVGTGGDYNFAFEAGQINPGFISKGAAYTQVVLAVAYWFASAGGANVTSVPSGYTDAGGEIIDLTTDIAGTRFAYKELTGNGDNPGPFDDGNGNYGPGGWGTLTLGIAYAQASGITVGTEDLADVVSQEHLRANGGDSSEFDVTELVGKEVIGFAAATSAREAIEQLMSAYYFEAVCSDKVYYRLRGGASVATIAFEDTGAGENNAGSPFVGPARDNPEEVPGKVAVTYVNLHADYDNGSEEGDRRVSTSNEVRQYQLGLVTTPDKAKGIADTIAADNYFAAQKSSVSLNDSSAPYEPTDVLTLTDEDGNTFRMRVVETMYGGGAYEHKLVIDDATILSEVGITTDSYSPSINLRILGDTELLLGDWPIFQDQYDDPGFWALMKPAAGTLWTTGAVLYESADGTTYVQDEAVGHAATFGTASTVLGDVDNPWVMDNVSTVTVDVGDGTLTSTTRDTLLSSSTNAMMVGAELIQFQMATLVSRGVYTLSGLLRGLKGTEWATGTHVAGEDVALLTVAGTQRVDRTVAELNAEFDYKAVTSGRNQLSATAVPFTDTGVGLKPYAPVDLRYDSGILTWDRRSRLDFTMLSSIEVPLGEDSEFYDVEVYDGSNVLLATQTVSQPQATIGALSDAFTVQAGQQYRAVSGEFIGITDAYPMASSNSQVIRRASDGTNLGAMLVGNTATVLANNGSTLYVAVINGSSAAYVYRISRTNITTSDPTLNASATYTATLAADPQGLAFDGTYLWVAEAYSGQLVKLNATTLASIATYPIGGSYTVGAMTYDSGSLWICDRTNAEVFEWDIGSTSEVNRFSCGAGTRPTDILVVGGLLFVAAGQVIVFDIATGIELHRYTQGYINDFRQVLTYDGTYVVFADLSANELVYLDASTGALDHVVSRSGLMGVSGYGSGYLFVSTRSGSYVTTKALTEVGVSAGYTLTVYQNSASVGRGYPASLTL